MSRAMYKIRGVAPRGLLVRLKDHVGRRLRTPEYFKIRLELSQERERIQAIVDTKAQALAIVYGLFLSRLPLRGHSRRKRVRQRVPGDAPRRRRRNVKGQLWHGFSELLLNSKGKLGR